MRVKLRFSVVSIRKATIVRKTIRSILLAPVLGYFQRMPVWMKTMKPGCPVGRCFLTFIIVLRKERLEELNAEYQDEVEVYLEVFETWLDAYNEWLKEHFAVDGVDVAGLDLNDDGEFNEEDLFGNPFGRGNRVGQPPRPYGPVMPMPQWPHPLPFHVPRANIDVRGFDGLPRIPDEIGE